jgi:hypothetical protein
VRRFALLLLALCAGCKPSQPQSAAKPAAAGPQVRATVVTVRTTVQPENKTFTQTIVMAGDRARSTGEQETWRLYDTKANTVTFVDAIEKTVRTESMASLVARRTAALRAPLPAHFDPAKVARTAERKTLHGVLATQVLITSGAYRRELWFGAHQQIPPGLFGMMHASEPLASPLAPMMRSVDEALLSIRGFPLADRTEVPSLEGNVIVERSVTSIAQQQVAEDVVAVPKGYRDVTPKPPVANTKKNQ